MTTRAPTDERRDPVPCHPETLIEEGRLFAAYLLGGRAPVPEAAERYARACLVLFGDSEPADEGELVRFARQHRWALPLLDAAAGLLRPRTLLRRKLVLMLAILEATPAHVSVFTPGPTTRGKLLARLLLLGLRSLVKVGGGVPVYLFARRGR